MNWLEITIVAICMATFSMAIVFAAWALDRIRMNRRSQLLDDIADTGKLQDVENLAKKLGIVLVPRTGFSEKRRNLHQLVWPESLGKFACSLLKAKQNKPEQKGDPEFDQFIQGIAVWLLVYYDKRSQRASFLKAMNRHVEIQQAVQTALEKEWKQILFFAQEKQWVLETAKGEAEKEGKRKRERQFRAWGLKPDTSSEEK